MTIQYNYIIVHKDDSIVLHSTGPIYFFFTKRNDYFHLDGIAFCYQCFVSVYIAVGLNNKHM